MEIKPIRTEEDYEQALDELALLMDEGEDTAKAVPKNRIPNP